jgi:hypothetical protein
MDMDFTADLLELLEEVMYRASSDVLEDYFDAGIHYVEAASIMYCNVIGAAKKQFHNLKDTAVFTGGEFVPVEGAGEVFKQKATCLISLPQQVVQDGFYLDIVNEIWLLEDETLRLVRCVQFEFDNNIIVHRVVMKPIEGIRNIGISADSIIEELDDYVLFANLPPA